MKRFVVSMALAAAPWLACAQASAPALAASAAPIASAPMAPTGQTPVGLWKTVDDHSKIEKSLVRITETNGVFSGRIEKLLDPSTAPDGVCDKCTDERKGRKILGLEILRNVRQSADSKHRWDGGDILDPANGKTYSVRLTPADGGKKLEVRGYIGAPLFGRSQTWQRVE